MRAAGRGDRLALERDVAADVDEHARARLVLGDRGLDLDERGAQVVSVAVDEDRLAAGGHDRERRRHERVGGAQHRLAAHARELERGERAAGPRAERDRRARRSRPTTPPRSGGSSPRATTGPESITSSNRAWRRGRSRSSKPIAKRWRSSSVVDTRRNASGQRGDVGLPRGDARPGHGWPCVVRCCAHVANRHHRRRHGSVAGARVVAGAGPPLSRTVVPRRRKRGQALLHDKPLIGKKLSMHALPLALSGTEWTAIGSIGTMLAAIGALASIWIARRERRNRRRTSCATARRYSRTSSARSSQRSSTALR